MIIIIIVIIIFINVKIIIITVMIKNTMNMMTVTHSDRYLGYVILP